MYFDTDDFSFEFIEDLMLNKEPQLTKKLNELLNKAINDNNEEKINELKEEIKNTLEDEMIALFNYE